MNEKVILVDENDAEIGTEEKLKVHQDGKLHRAFSIFVFNSKGELLLQKRAGSKYHSGGLWSNTCCGHPRPGEGVKEAAHRRLREEMGFDCLLKPVFSFCYNASLDKGLTENEYDHVFSGVCRESPRPDSKEVADWKWAGLKEIKKDILKNPNLYTYWFKVSIKRLNEIKDSVSDGI
jgi:isopentenyl-diphosphate Delta-isomerase